MYYRTLCSSCPVSSPAPNKKEGPCLVLPAMVRLMQPRILSTFFAPRTQCWSMLNIGFTRTPTSFSAKGLSSLEATSMYWWIRKFLRRCWPSHLLLSNFLRFLTAQFSSLSRSISIAAKTFCISDVRRGFVPSANLLREQSSSTHRWLIT